MKMKKKYSKKVIAKIIVLIILFIVLLADLVYVSFYRDKGKNNAKIRVEETIQKEETKDSNTPFITNLETFVTPSLGSKDVLVNEELEKYCMLEKGKILSAEVFYVTVPDANENQIIFFAKLNPSNEIVEIVFDFKTDALAVHDCVYTQEQILNETWEGNCPTVRDIQE